MSDLTEESDKALDAAARASLKLQRIFVFASPDRSCFFDMSAALDAQHERDLAVLEYTRCRRVNEGVDDPESSLREIKDRMINLSIAEIDSIICG
jgi:hypothetical protein